MVHVYGGNQIYVEDNQISNFGCPPSTNFRFEFCYPARYPVPTEQYPLTVA